MDFLEHLAARALSSDPESDDRVDLGVGADGPEPEPTLADAACALRAALW